MRYLIVISIVLSMAIVMAQTTSSVTLKIVSLPVNTSVTDTLYVAGNLNRWNPKDPNFQFKKVDGVYTLTLTQPVGTKMFYKITKGSWDYVEKGKGLYEIDNRKLVFEKGSRVVNIRIVNWRVPHKKPKRFTITGNVYLLKDFKVPELYTIRDLRIYLPPDYETSNKRYPVLYMQDGQNVFDNATSFVGEWQVDETLEKLFREGKTDGVIVVAVDHAGVGRYNEYSPWINHINRKGGKGDQYARFITKTLKPFVDSYYRTLPSREHTAIAGSDMGAFISLYTALKYQDVFSKVGVFSPCFWFAKRQIVNFINSIGQKRDMMIYMDVGTREGINRMQTLAYPRDAREIVDLLAKKGFARDNIHFFLDHGAGHHEKDWARRFPKAFTWLFPNK